MEKLTLGSTEHGRTPEQADFTERHQRWMRREVQINKAIEISMLGLITNGLLLHLMAGNHSPLNHVLVPATLITQFLVGFNETKKNWRAALQNPKKQRLAVAELASEEERARAIQDGIQRFLQEYGE